MKKAIPFKEVLATVAFKVDHASLASLYMRFCMGPKEARLAEPLEAGSPLSVSIDSMYYISELETGDFFEEKLREARRVYRVSLVLVGRQRKIAQIRKGLPSNKEMSLQLAQYFLARCMEFAQDPHSWGHTISLLLINGAEVSQVARAFLLSSNKPPRKEGPRVHPRPVQRQGSPQGPGSI